MRAQLVLLVVSAAGCSCAPRNRVPPATPVARNAPVPPMERQIRNAIDAGDGDYEIQHMRQKMTANPDDLQLRLDLARLYRKRGYTEVAIEHYRLAATRFPDSAEVQLELIKAL